MFIFAQLCFDKYMYGMFELFTILKQILIRRELLKTA